MSYLLDALFLLLLPAAVWLWAWHVDRQLTRLPRTVDLYDEADPLIEAQILEWGRIPN